MRKKVNVPLAWTGLGLMLVSFLLLLGGVVLNTYALHHQDLGLLKQSHHILIASPICFWTGRFLSGIALGDPHPPF